MLLPSQRKLNSVTLTMILRDGIHMQSRFVGLLQDTKPLLLLLLMSIKHIPAINDLSYTNR